MDPSLRDLIRERARQHCEYCRLPQWSTPLVSFHIEHVIAKQHQGGDDPGNLALCCNHCNSHKGPNIAGLDVETGNIVPLFHPRRDAWEDHFAIHGTSIIGLTPTGRVTVHVLKMNASRRLRLRKALQDRQEWG